LICPKSIEETSTLLSLGINDDWSFETDFKKKRSVSSLYVDSNTSFIFLLKIFAKKFIFFFYYKITDIIHSFLQLFRFILIKKKIINKYISYGDIHYFTKTLTPPFFLKIDIDGSEYRILKDLLEIKKKLSGLIIEFHNIDLFMGNIKYFVKNIGLKLIHVHANNTLEHVTKTNVIELTFSKNPILINSTINLPHLLDQKNYIKNKEIKILFK
jgi:hypothetical protein